MHYLSFLLYFLGKTYFQSKYSCDVMNSFLSWNLYNPSNFMQHALSDVMWNTNLTLKSFLSSRSNLSQGKIMSSISFWSHIFTFLSSYIFLFWKRFKLKENLNGCIGIWLLLQKGSINCEIWGAEWLNWYWMWVDNG